ncbi:MAG: hypothetical protein ACLU0O_05965 [Collinsella sp.]
MLDRLKAYHEQTEPLVDSTVPAASWRNQVLPSIEETTQKS